MLDDEHLIFADIHSPQTVRNLASNPAIEVNAVDFIARKGYRFRGTAQVLAPGDDDYDFMRSWLLAAHGDSQPCNHAVKIHVIEASPLLSPAYTIDHVAESDLRQAWITKYALTTP